MAIEWIDTHAHLDDEQFSSDVSAVIARAQAVGGRAIVTIATTAASTRRCQELASTFPLVWASAGIQPNQISQEPADAWDETSRLAASQRVVAIGETGLDRHWDYTPFDLQEDYFDRHLQLARVRNLPVVIHCREAEPDVVRMLRQEFDRAGPIRGVMHSFTGSLDTARACLAMGLHISFAGMITYKNAQGLRAICGQIPLDRLLVETDSPYLPPVPYRGKRNEPSYLIQTIESIAACHGLDSDKIAACTTRNALELFKLM